MKIKFLNNHKIEALLTVKTGLKIGAGKDSIEIGGIDSPVVKHPHSLLPYIPGSSLKGKLRSLLEWSLNCIEKDGSVWGSETVPASTDVIVRTFGITNDKWDGGPSRLLVRDAHLHADWYTKIKDRNLPLTEAKSEVTINRIQGKAAANIGPRTMERVPSGAEFDVEMLFKRYAVADDTQGLHDLACVNRVIEAMRLLEEDALGGSGSRGYGRVEFSNIKVDGIDITAEFRQHRPFDPKTPFAFVAR
jgi:CRISPR-associated protein Csm3